MSDTNWKALLEALRDKLGSIGVLEGRLDAARGEYQRIVLDGGTPDRDLQRRILKTASQLGIVSASTMEPTKALQPAPPVAPASDAQTFTGDDLRELVAQIRRRHGMGTREIATAVAVGKSTLELYFRCAPEKIPASLPGRLRAILDGKPPPPAPTRRADVAHLVERRPHAEVAGSTPAAGSLSPKANDIFVVCERILTLRDDLAQAFDALRLLLVNG